MVVNADVLTEEECSNWLATLRTAYPTRWFKLIGDDRGKTLMAEIDPDEWDVVGEYTHYYNRKDDEVDLLAVIKDKPYYEKVMASMLAGKDNEQ